MRQTEFTAGLEHQFNSSLSLGLRFVHKQIDRAIEDIGVIVPGIGEVFYIGNPGEGATRSILGAGFPNLPQVQRDYDAIEAHLTKRFGNNWRGDVIYRYARLYGNYPGLASSDENGRVAPNVERMFDALQMAFDQNGDPVYGRLRDGSSARTEAGGLVSVPVRHAARLLSVRRERHARVASGERHLEHADVLPRTRERWPAADVHADRSAGVARRQNRRQEVAERLRRTC